MDDLHYTEEDLDLYPIYMEYNRGIIMEHQLPDRVRKNMLNGKTLQKIDDNTWEIQNSGYSVKIQPFKKWLLQRVRDEKLDSIGIC